MLGGGGGDHRVVERREREERALGRAFAGEGALNRDLPARRIDQVGAVVLLAQPIADGPREVERTRLPRLHDVARASGRGHRLAFAKSPREGTVLARADGRLEHVAVGHQPEVAATRPAFHRIGRGTAGADAGDREPD